MNEIKLTPKQKSVLEGLADILARHNYKKVPVSDIHCNLTAVKKIVAPNWFDRTFNKLEELGLVEKENMDFIVPGGYRKGVVEKTYTYNITELGLEYLGMTIDDIPVIVDEKGEKEMLKEQLIEMKANSEGIELFVINDILEFNESDEEISNYINNVLTYGCESGCVSSLLYYRDTKKFFNKYSDEILSILDELNDTGGIPFEIDANNLAWLGYEETIKNIATEIGIW